ncbi:MAG: hypothetical protein ACXWZB_07075 [Gaiellaceae bacterium]
MARRRRNLVVAGLAALIVLCGAAVVAWGSIPDGAGAIHACYHKSNGSVRIIDPDLTECKRGELPIEWDVQGPAGEPGQQGEQGPQGEPGAGVDGFTTTFGPTPVPTANVSTPELVILSGLPAGPSFATVSLNVSNGSGQAVALICAIGEAGPAYSFNVPGNSSGPGPYTALVSFSGRANSTGVPLGCHIWGDPANPVENVTVTGMIQALSLSSLTVQAP